MKPKSLWVAVAVTAVLIVSLVVAEIAFSAPWKGWRGSGGWGPGTPYQRLYNPATAETISGAVEDVQSVVPMRGMNTGVQLILKTEKETIPVMLGPAWYIERLDVKIQKGDTIEVKGSRITLSGKPAFIAAEIKKGDKTLVLRDSSGIPAWAGWRGRW
jgi:hypothetical protein